MIIEHTQTKDIRQGAYVVFAASDRRLLGAAAALDTEVGGHVSKAVRLSPLFGKVGTIVEMLAPRGSSASRILICSLGEPAVADSAAFEKIGASIVSFLLTSGESAITVDLSGLSALAIPGGEAANRLGHGARLRNYNFDRYKTKKRPAELRTLERMTIVGSVDMGCAQADLRALESGVYLTRDLVSEPPNILDPVSFVERVSAAAPPGLEIEVLDEREMAALGMGAFLAVGQGSPRESRVLSMRWNGGAAAKPVILIGKGVTFDAGGITLKPSPYIEQMKWDMAGAAAVAGTLHALAARNARANVVGICGLVENMPDGQAQRPSDVVRSLSGQTIEVVNTDAEGRLVLCDLLSWAQQVHEPDIIVDVATLTGALIAGIGREYGWLFSNSEDLSRSLQDAGQAVSEKLWPMPMGEVYDRMIDSTIADMKNFSQEEASAVTAAQFLRRFVEPRVKWAHLDITAVVWSMQPTVLSEEGATGYGVRLLDRFIRDACEHPDGPSAA